MNHFLIVRKIPIYFKKNKKIKLIYTNIKNKLKTHENT